MGIPYQPVSGMAGWFLFDRGKGKRGFRHETTGLSLKREQEEAKLVLVAFAEKSMPVTACGSLIPAPFRVGDGVALSLCLGWKKGSVQVAVSCCLSGRGQPHGRVCDR